jgi:hypothetical protein
VDNLLGLFGEHSDDLRPRRLLADARGVGVVLRRAHLRRLSSAVKRSSIGRNEYQSI